MICLKLRQAGREAAQAKADDVVKKLKAMKLGAAAKLAAEAIDETLAYRAFPLTVLAEDQDQ